MFVKAIRGRNPASPQIFKTNSYDSKEFYEKHKGEYFIHKNQKVRVVGYHGYSFDALIVSISKGNGMGFVTAQEVFKS